MIFIEEGDHQIFPLQQKHRQTDGPDDRELRNILWGDSKDISHDDGLDAD